MRATCAGARYGDVRPFRELRDGSPRRREPLVRARPVPERLMTVPVDVHDLYDRPARCWPIAPLRPTHRDDGARGDVSRQAERTAGEPGAPQRQRYEPCAKPRRSRSEEQILDGRVDRAVVARRGDGRERKPNASKTGHHHYGDLSEVVGLPLDGVEDALHLRALAHGDPPVCRRRCETPAD